jgi:hypothetical protein
MRQLQLAPFPDSCWKVGEVGPAKFRGFLWSQAGVVEDTKEGLQSCAPLAVSFDRG